MTTDVLVVVCFVGVAALCFAAGGLIAYTALSFYAGVSFLLNQISMSRLMAIFALPFLNGVLCLMAVCENMSMRDVLWTLGLIDGVVLLQWVVCEFLNTGLLAVAANRAFASDAPIEPPDTCERLQKNMRQHPRIWLRICRSYNRIPQKVVERLCSRAAANPWV